jgi:membrane fusion protein (multidrug efflux system)
MQSRQKSSQKQRPETAIMTPVIGIDSRVAPAEPAAQSAEGSFSTAAHWRLKLSAKQVLLITLGVVLVAVTAVAGNNWVRYLLSHEETDDAYITGHLHQVSSRVDGTVDKVWVDDNEHVKQGQVLVTLDPNDYKAQADQALANLEQAKRQIQTAQTTISYQDTDAQGQDMNAKGSVANALAGISRSEAQVREAQAAILAAQNDLKAKDGELERATIDYKRYDYLGKQGAVALTQSDAAKRDYIVALGNRDAARDAITQATERLKEAQDSVNTSKAQLAQAQAQIQLAKASAVQVQVNQAQLNTDLAAVAKAKAALDAANLNLSYTKIVAPISGRIGKKTVEEGHRVQPGEPLMTIVSDDPWVVANYKETQLKRIRAGQKVEITIDSFPDHKFEGHVLSFSPASGASFAILPSDNATGNFTKIVQRLPVKILFTPESIVGYEDRLAPGLSVISSVDVVSPAEPLTTVAQVR